jgi:hypothetical protein
MVEDAGEEERPSLEMRVAAVEDKLQELASRLDRQEALGFFEKFLRNGHSHIYGWAPDPMIVERVPEEYWSTRHC